MNDKKSEEIKEVEELRRYKQKHNLSFDQLSKQLDVHVNSTFRWLSLGIVPSLMAMRIIRDFLKSKEEEE